MIVNLVFYKNVYWISPWSSIPQNSSYTVTVLPSLKPLKSDERDTQNTAGEERASSFATFSCRLLHKRRAGVGRPALYRHRGTAEFDGRWTMESLGNPCSWHDMMMMMMNMIMKKNYWVQFYPRFQGSVGEHRLRVWGRGATVHLCIFLKKQNNNNKKKNNKKEKEKTTKKQRNKKQN